ncbi:MAG: signal peptidase II [Candidatus Cryosericum sp.]|nr:signal peptidase II [bacterium]
MNERASLLRWFSLLAVMIAADQLTKWGARRFLAGNPLTSNLMGLILTMNSGVAFGLFGGRAWVVPLNALLGCAVFIAGLVAFRHGEGGVASGFFLIFAGFAGNFIDRVVMGKVTDFIWIRGWSVFNLADCFVTAGAILCGLALVFPKRWGFHG